MRLLQRYILLDLLRVFLALLSVLTILLVFVGVFQQVSESGLGPLQVLQILPFVVPSLLPFTIPATLLLTVCLVYGRMAGDLEITASKAAGINVFSLLWPSFALGILLSVCSLYLSDQVIPWAVTNIQRTVTAAMEDIFLDVLRTRHKISDPSRGFTVTVMDVDGKTLVKPTFQYLRSGRDAVTVQAQEATLEFDLENQQVLLHLVRGYIDIPGERRVWFEREDRPFPLPSEITQPKPRNITISALLDRLEAISARTSDLRDRRDIETAFALASGEFDRFTTEEYRNYDVELGHESSRHNRHRSEIHTRIALAGSCFFFVFLGAPVAILQARRQFLTTFLLCFLPILLAYYPIVLGMMSLAKTGSVDPAWAMWVGNAGLFVAGGYFLWKVLRY